MATERHATTGGLHQAANFGVGISENLLHLRLVGLAQWLASGIEAQIP